MTACQSCETGVPEMPGAGRSRQVLGNCAACDDPVCGVHGEYDTASGKLLCLDAIANLLTASASVRAGGHRPSAMRITDTENYQQRFPATYRTVHRYDHVRGERLPAQEATPFGLALDAELALGPQYELAGGDGELIAEAVLLERWLTCGPEEPVTPLRRPPRDLHEDAIAERRGRPRHLPRGDQRRR